MAKPSILTPWNVNQINQAQPNTARQDDGWLVAAGVPEKPPVEYFNYMMNEYYRWFDAVNKHGVLPWDNQTIYLTGSVVTGTDGQLYIATAANTNVNPVGDATGTWQMQIVDIARIQTPLYYRASTTQVAISGGAFFHDGTRKQVILNPAELTYTINSPGVSQYQYIYLDDSAIVSAGSNILTTAMLTNSSTPPTKSLAKGGYYNGNDKFLFSVYINSSGSILEFYHDGLDYVNFGSEINNTVVPLNSWNVLTPTVPDGTRKIRITAVLITNVTQSVSLKIKGGTDATAIITSEASTSNIIYSNTLDALIDADKQFSVFKSSGTLYIKVLGYYLPPGM